MATCTLFDQVFADLDIAEALKLALLHDCLHLQAAHLLLHVAHLLLNPWVEGVGALTPDLIHQPLTFLLQLTQLLIRLERALLSSRTAS